MGWGTDSTACAIDRRGVEVAQRVGLALGLVVALLAAPPPASAQGSAGTITYAGADGNIWIMAADDPSSARQVTTDGDPELPYIAPVQSDDGIIYAVQREGFGQVVVLSQDGTELAPPYRPQAQNKIDDLALSPDGTLLAVSSAQFNQTGDNVVVASFETDFVDPLDGTPAGPQNLPDPYPSFYSNTELVFAPYNDSPYDVAGLTTYDLTDPGHQPWQDTCPSPTELCDLLTHPVIASDFEHLAAPARDRYQDHVLVLYEMTGRPPAPIVGSCVVPIRSEGGRYERPSWSPDGDSLVVTFGSEVYQGTPPEGAGIYIGRDFAGCDVGFASFELAVPDAEWPHWSAAPLGATPGEPGDPGDPGDPGSPAPPQGQLTDGTRLDGGSIADPVGQAIATSELLFDDGAADRVVLATADAFPDALAGTALAGDTAPILLTSGDGGLDPRVADEITRVTGGDGVVLVLGGVNAVSDQAADEAAAAAGDRPCTAPLPASCRFAGEVREHTAALISDVVLAEHPGDTVLIARQDNFADAITGGAYAARAGVPILLTHSTFLSSQTEAFLDEHAINSAIVLGGEAAVDEPTYQSLPVQDRRRVAGAERTATAVAIAEQLWAPAGFGQGGRILVNVRHDQGWQTALTAAVASAAFDAPQLGVENPPTGLSESTRQHLSAFSGPLMAFGGTDLVSDQQMDQAAVARG